MNAIVLVGGLGTRLRPLTLTQPKALLPVFNRPFLAYQLDLLRQTGVSDVMLAAGHIIRKWEREIKKLQLPGLRIHFAYEPTPLGTGGAIRFSYDALKRKKLLKKGPVIVFNGDIFFDFDPRKFLSFHSNSMADGTILLTKIKNPSRFGVVSIGPNGRIKKFVEKPKNASFGCLINAGAYALSSDWIERIPRSTVVSVEKDTFPLSLTRGDRMFGFKMNGYWNDIGTPETYLSAHRDLLMKSNRWTRQGLLRKRGRLVDASSLIGKNVVFEGVVSCGRKVVISDDCVLRDCILMDQVFIGRGSKIDGSILGRQCRIGEYSFIGAGSVLGDRTVLPSHTKC